MYLSRYSFDSEDDKKDYDKVLKKFDEYFIPQRNVIHERATFHKRDQNPGETIETFVRYLYEGAEHCDFLDKKEQIRDRLVLGILDKELSEKTAVKIRPYTRKGDRNHTSVRNGEVAD